MHTVHWASHLFSVEPDLRSSKLDLWHKWDTQLKRIMFARDHKGHNCLGAQEEGSVSDLCPLGLQPAAPEAEGLHQGPGACFIPRGAVSQEPGRLTSPCPPRGSGTQPVLAPGMTQRIGLAAHGSCNLLSSPGLYEGEEQQQQQRVLPKHRFATAEEFWRRRAGPKRLRAFIHKHRLLTAHHGSPPHSETPRCLVLGSTHRLPPTTRPPTQALGCFYSSVRMLALISLGTTEAQAGPYPGQPSRPPPAGLTALPCPACGSAPRRRAAGRAAPDPPQPRARAQPLPLPPLPVPVPAAPLTCAGSARRRCGCPSPPAAPAPPPPLATRPSSSTAHTAQPSPAEPRRALPCRAEPSRALPGQRGAAVRLGRPRLGAPRRLVAAEGTAPPAGARPRLLGGPRPCPEGREGRRQRHL